MKNKLVVTESGTLIPAKYDKERIALTKETAFTANHFEHRTLTNKDGSPARARRVGKTRTWKKKPDYWEIPVRHGLYVSFVITSETSKDWYIA